MLPMINHGDCLAVLKTFPDACVDSVVTDPPYGLKLLGKRWDYDVPSAELWREVLRVLKPGGYGVMFAGTRTYHRMVCAVEDGGFEVRDQLAWVYGSGVPKTMSVDEAVTSKAPEQAGVWSGWGTALKPAIEPICLARRPPEGTLTANIIKYGVGGYNIDACRVPGESPSLARREVARRTGVTPGTPRDQTHTLTDRTSAERYIIDKPGETLGRFPANLIHDGSDAVAEALEGAAKFFYTAKPGAHERAGFKHPTLKPLALMRYLCRLITPPGGIVLDPFAGSGTTGSAAIAEGFHPVLIEREEEYVQLIRSRKLESPVLPEYP